MGSPQSITGVRCTSTIPFAKLRFYLIERGVRFSWVAEKAGIEYNRSCRLCAGVNEPTLHEALLLKQVLFCQLEQIFDTDVVLPGEERNHD